MKAVYFDFPFECECGCVMELHDNMCLGGEKYLSCSNKGCPNSSKQFEVPTMELKEVQAKREANALTK